MSTAGLIQPSLSRWSAPVCIVSQKDGTPRFCVDFRKINYITTKDAYPLPMPDYTFKALACSRWFHIVDMQTDYWQIKSDTGDQYKTAFATHRGLFEFRVMPMVLSNSSASYRKIDRKCVGKLELEKCLCYLDDIIIFGAYFDIALQNLREIFER